MVKGTIKRFRHEHHLKIINEKVIIKDIFQYTSPLGILGKIADFLFLKIYMKNFLLERNKVIKNFAETDKWKDVLNV
jgi:ligand-binding SRPBCC domain-containing protein